VATIKQRAVAGSSVENTTHAANGHPGRLRPQDGPSVLFDGARSDELAVAPGCFKDLNLDQAVDEITARREEYNLKPVFYAALADARTIVYRQEVMRDTERQDIAECIRRFAKQMGRMRADLTLVGKLQYKRQREAWYLEAIDTYCNAVRDLSGGLKDAPPDSRALKAIRHYLAAYLRSEDFLELDAETEKLGHDLGQVRYVMTIKSGSVRVTDPDGDEDYGAKVESTFERFKAGAVKDHRARYATLQEMGHVEAAVLEFVAKLRPDLFAELESYCERHREYLDQAVTRFDREIQFYLAFHEYTEPIRAAGLQFCYPQVSDSREIGAQAAFDLPLARKLTGRKTEVVTNDWRLSGLERIFVVSGPNQGGKTTFARMFGQLHYLASLGCPVPGTQARLLLFDRLLTHFEKQEDLSDRHGKLEDDLIRVHDILEQATDQTIVVMNESFTSTTLDDARFLGTQILERMIALDVLGVYVTFVDELASLGESIVSATSTVDEHDPTARTFKIARRPADGLAYAAALAEKYRLTYHALRERVGS
jgi:DNA mismatch repair protein MutS